MNIVRLVTDSVATRDLPGWFGAAVAASPAAEAVCVEKDNKEKGLYVAMAADSGYNSDRIEPRAESSVHGAARRLDLPRPHGQPSPTATPIFPPPARRRAGGVGMPLPGLRNGASCGAWVSR